MQDCMGEYPTVYNKTTLDDDKEMGLDLEGMEMEETKEDKPKGDVYADADDQTESQNELEVKN